MLTGLAYGRAGRGHPRGNVPPGGSGGAGKVLCGAGGLDRTRPAAAASVHGRTGPDDAPPGGEGVACADRRLSGGA
eukprot:1182541-Prorocentrum_minimum.AAC.7